MKFEDLKIYLIDIDEPMVAEWKGAFSAGDYPNVEILHSTFSEFINLYPVEGVVSPANSYGLMDGGYDLAITNVFGGDLMEAVQRHIINFCYGEQPVASAICVSIPGAPERKLIHVPTMRIPSKIKDYELVYHCTRAAIICALQNGIKSIVLPAFGGSCGCVPRDILAMYMERAINSFRNVPELLNWRFARRESSLGTIENSQ